MITILSWQACVVIKVENGVGSQREEALLYAPSGHYVFVHRSSRECQCSRVFTRTFLCNQDHDVIGESMLEVNGDKLMQTRRLAGLR